MNHKKIAGLTRLELATFRVTGGRSNQTELQPHYQFFLSFFDAIPNGMLQENSENKWLPGQDSNLRPND